MDLQAEATRQPDSYWQRTENARLADQRKRYQRRPKITVTPTWKLAASEPQLEEVKGQ